MTTVQGEMNPTKHIESRKNLNTMRFTSHNENTNFISLSTLHEVLHSRFFGDPVEEKEGGGGHGGGGKERDLRLLNICKPSSEFFFHF